MEFQHLKSLAVALLIDSFKKWLSLYNYDHLFLHLALAFSIVPGKDVHDQWCTYCELKSLDVSNLIFYL